MASKSTCLAAALAFVGIVLALGAGVAPAVEVAGVNVPDQVVLESSGESLVLNGAGVRKKFVIKVYVGALYLGEKSTSVEDILAREGGKRVAMHFLYKEVEAGKLVAAWNDGFKANLSADEMAAVQERLNRFNELFQTVRKGDVYQLDFIPGRGTEVSLNGTAAGTVEGEDFFRALLKVWLGTKPADKGLKKAWLGK
jgi:hypothetical protein